MDTVLGQMAHDVVFLVPGREPMGKSGFAAAAKAQASGAAPKFDGTSLHKQHGRWVLARDANLLSPTA